MRQVVALCADQPLELTQPVVKDYVERCKAQKMRDRVHNVVHRHASDINKVCPCLAGKPREGILTKVNSITKEVRKNGLVSLLYNYNK